MNKQTTFGDAWFYNLLNSTYVAKERGEEEERRKGGGKKLELE